MKQSIAGWRVKLARSTTMAVVKYLIEENDKQAA